MRCQVSWKAAYLQGSPGEPALGGVCGTWLHMQRLGPAGQHMPLRAHAHRVAARLLQLRPAATPQCLQIGKLR